MTSSKILLTVLEEYYNSDPTTRGSWEKRIPSPEDIGLDISDFCHNFNFDDPIIAYRIFFDRWNCVRKLSIKDIRSTDFIHSDDNSADLLSIGSFLHKITPLQALRILGKTDFSFGNFWHALSYLNSKLSFIAFKEDFSLIIPGSYFKGGKNGPKIPVFHRLNGNISISFILADALEVPVDYKYLLAQGVSH